MDLFGIGSIVQGITGLIGTGIQSGLNYQAQQETNNTNIKLYNASQSWTNYWNREQMNEAQRQYNQNRFDSYYMWNSNRADNYNATQIRAQDLKQAGLSKNLAAGSAAVSTPAVQAGTSNASPNGSPGAPKLDSPQVQGLERLGMVGEAISNIARGQNLEADTNYKKAQAIIEMKREGLITSEEARNYAQTDYWNAIAQPTANNLNASANNQNAQANATNYDRGLAEATGTKTGEKVTPANKFEAVYRTAAMAKHFTETVGTRSQLVSDAQSAQRSGVDFESWYDSLPPKQKEHYSKQELAKIYKNANVYSGVKKTSKPGVKHRGNQLNY